MSTYVAILVLPLNSLFEGVFLVYRNSTDFYVSLLYPTISLNSLVVIVFDGVFKVFNYNIISSTSCDSFTLSFSIWMCFITFLA